MIDPFSALGAVSSILQVIDFGSKLLREGYGAYKSAQGATTDDLHAEELTTDLQGLVGKLAATQTSTVAADDDALRKLANQAHDLAEQLIIMLQDLKVRSDAKVRTFESLRQASRRLWKADKLERKKKGLQQLESRVNTYLLKILRDEQSSVVVWCKKLVDEHVRLQLEHTNHLNETRAALLQAVTDQERETKALLKATRDKYQGALRSFQASFDQLSRTLTTMRNEAVETEKTQRILRTLSFPGMLTRQADIHEAYSETFKWIFDADETPFKLWLRENAGIFWLAGKPGSGKSTLMKFLADHEQTKSALTDWSDSQGKALIIAEHYFLRSSSTAQKSSELSMQETEEGFLRTLLYQILRQCPRLIPMACQVRWNDNEFDLRQKWSRSELSETFARIVTHGTQAMSTCFCFFIDGLDEYSGDQYELLNDFDRLAGSPAVKLCVSSRQHAVFHDRYNQHALRQIVLQEFNKSDIERYIRGKLEEDNRFKRLAERDQRAYQLILEIRERAEGVFVWVFLVVRSLLRGMTNNDDIETLQERLEEFPKDLDPFLTHMVNQIEPVYREKFAIISLMRLKMTVPVTATRYLPDELAQKEWVLNAPVEEWSDLEIEELRWESTSRVTAWCQDLLEVRSFGFDIPAPYHVDFLHRTVRDFLSEDEMQTYLNAQVKRSFDMYLFTSKLRLREARATAVSKGSEIWRKQFFLCTLLCLLSAKGYDGSQESAALLVDYLLELDRVGSLLYDPEPGAACWISAFPATFPAHLPSSQAVHVSAFVQLAVMYQCIPFVKHSLATNMTLERPELPLLFFALQECTSGGSYWDPSLDIVELLLKAGADCNEGIEVATRHGGTVWELFLVRCADQRSPDLWPIAKTLLIYGANPYAKVHVAIGDEETQAEVELELLSAIDCLKRCADSPEGAREIEQAVRQAQSKLRPALRSAIFAQVRRSLGFT